MKFNIVCIDTTKRTYYIVHTVESKKEAIEWIEQHEHEYPECSRLDFVREGFFPSVE